MSESGTSSPADRRTTAFDDQQFANPYPDGIERHYWTMARSRIIYHRLKGLLEQRDDVVLDVGCGRGLMVHWLRERGVEAVGCDLGTPRPMNDQVAPHLHLGTSAEAMAAGDIGRRTRVMLLLDVLEHLPQPAEFLASLLARFENCRHVLMTVPARRELWSNYDDYYGHVKRYDRTAVAELGGAAGCEFTYCGYFFHGLYPPARVLGMLGKDRSTAIIPPAGARGASTGRRRVRAGGADRSPFCARDVDPGGPLRAAK